MDEYVHNRLGTYPHLLGPLEGHVVGKKVPEHADQPADCEEAVLTMIMLRPMLEERSTNRVMLSGECGENDQQCATAVLKAGWTVQDVINETKSKTLIFTIIAHAPRRSQLPPCNATLVLLSSSHARANFTAKRDFPRMRGNGLLYNALIDMLARHRVSFRKEKVKPARAAPMTS